MRGAGIVAMLHVLRVVEIVRALDLYLRKCLLNDDGNGFQSAAVFSDLIRRWLMKRIAGAPAVDGRRRGRGGFVRPIFGL